MDQDATWYEGRPRPRPHCVTWGPSSPSQKPLIFGSRLLWPNGRPSQLLLSSCWNIVMLRVVLCFNAYVVNKFHDNEHCICTCSDWAVCDTKRGRFAIHCFGTMLQAEVLKNVSVSALQGLVSWQISDVSVSWNYRKVLVSDQKPNVSVSSRSRKLKVSFTSLVWDLVHRFSEPAFWISPQLAVTWHRSNSQQSHSTHWHYHWYRMIFRQWISSMSVTGQAFYHFS